MKVCFKKILPILTLLLIIMVIPQTFAADNDNTTDLTSQITQEIAVDDAVDEVVGADEEGSEAIYVSTQGDDSNNGTQKAPFATIYRAVNEAYDTGIKDIYISEGTYNENSLEIQSSVNIVGLGDVIIDAEEKGRIFKIEGLYDVQISGLTLMNGVAPTDAWTQDIHETIWYAGGGAINIVDAYVTMENMTFINNYAEDFGGAINTESEYTIIRNSKFMSNYAGVFGGAIDFEADFGTVENCTFIANEAGNGAGIGYIASAGRITDSYFENNTAENGGAIFIENGAMTENSTNEHIIRNNKFVHNEAVQQGGAIEVENQQMSENADWSRIEGNEFIDNYAYNGGAISAYYGDAGILNNMFINNSAGYGGAIAAISTTDSSYIIIGGLYLKNNTMINCTAEENGNTIYNMGYYGTTVNITFCANQTVESLDGKAVILNITVCDDMGNPISGSPIDFTVNGVKTINPASDLTEGVGTVRFVPRENGTFEISGIFTHKFKYDNINLKTGQIIVDNAIADYFGTIHVSDGEGDDDNTGAEDSPVKTFTQAYILATRDGGSFDVVVNRGTYYVPGYTISQSFNVTGIGNPILDGKNQGTLFSLYGAPDDEFHITGVTFKNGVADPSKYAGMNEGGAIFFKGGNLFLENDTFMYNSAKDYGGAVHINKGQSAWGDLYPAFASVNNCTFKNNLANYFGGAISLYDCDVIVSNCNFESNTAEKKGGAISVLNGLGNVTVINSSFYKNSASDTGGAIEAECLNTYNVRYFADIFNSTFKENTANLGGAIAAGDANISGCAFFKNSANLAGGAIFINETFLGEDIINQSYVNYCIFEDNDAVKGYSIYTTSVLIDNNFYGKNYDSFDNLTNARIVNVTTENHNVSWVNVEITGLDKILIGNSSYTLRFISSTGDELAQPLPDYNLKVSNSDSNNKLEKTEVLITNNEATVAYDANNKSDDTISVLDADGNAITSIGVSVHVKMDSIVEIKNVSYAVNSPSKTITAVLKDENNTPIADKELLFNINNETFNASTDSEGIATLNLNLTKSGTYAISATFAGDLFYGASDNSASVKINKVSSKLSVPNKSFVITTSKKTLTVTLKDGNGNALANKKVNVTVNGKITTLKTNSKGQASLTISLAAKSYRVTTKFAGDDTYSGSSKVSTLKIVKEKPKIKAAKKTYKKSAKNKKLTVTLKTSKGKAISGKKITFKVNGKKYTANTNKKGQATVKVKLTSKKTYIFTAKFAGNSKYSAVSVKSSVRIK